MCRIDNGKDSSGSGRSNGSSSLSYFSLDSSLILEGQEETLRSEDFSSKLGRGYIYFIRVKYEVPSYIGMRHLEKGEKLEESFAEHVGFEFHVRPLIHAYAQEFLNKVNLAPS